MHGKLHLKVVLIPAALLIMALSAGCDDGPTSATGSVEASGSPGATPSGFPAGPTSLEEFDTSNLQLAADQILAGGPAKDGIPSLTNPETVPLDEADFLRPDDRMAVITVEDQARGYPMRLLNWHEAINDSIAGTDFALVYCPLCDSVSVVNRQIRDDKVLEFGISGLLHNSNVLLYDRTDQALWSQVGLSAISGPHAGESLDHLPWQITTFEQYRRRHPSGTVASFETGYDRDYGRNPYGQYFETEQLMFPVVKDDDRLPAKAGVVGVKLGDTVRAYPVERVAAAPDGRVQEPLGDGHIILQADAETGGVEVAQVPPDAQVIHTFWFTWAAFHPETTIFEAGE